MKQCPKCCTTKPSTAFGRNRGRRDGMQTYCFDCRKAIYLERQEHEVQYQLKYISTHRDKVAQWHRNSLAKPENRAKNRTRGITQNAIRSGKLVKPDNCEHCGESVRLYAHHHDYTKPLEVEFLCSRCHGAVHRALNAMEVVA